MKFSTTILAALAPVALAKSVHNQFPKRGRHGGKNAASNYEKNSQTEVIVIWVNPGGSAATTTVNQQVTVTQTVTVGGQATVAPGLEASTTIAGGATGTVVGTGATHTVVVGGAGGLTYQPDNVKAAIGDMVIFTFMSKNHTATQSAFDTPCDPLAGGMDSGFQANPDNSVIPPPQVAMQVMVDTPLWFYCKQANHCGTGMTFSINPTADKTQAMFQALAIQQRGTGTPSAIVGGEAAPPPPDAANPAESASASVAPSESLALPGAAAPTESLALPGAAEPTESLATLPGAEATSTLAEVATATGEVVQGTGSVLPDGSCACAVVVGAGAFPAVGAQGVGSFGGMAGALPATMAEAI